MSEDREPMIIRNSNDLENALKKAFQAYHRSDTGRAETIYRDIIRQHPGNIVANRNLGILLQYKHQHEESVPYFKAALEAKPNDPGSWIQLADALIRARYLEDAQRLIGQLASQGVKGPLYDDLRFKHKMAATQPAAPSSSTLHTSEVSRHVQELVNSGELKRAESIARLLTQLYPDYKAGWVTLIRIFQDQSTLGSAINTAQSAFDRFPHDRDLGVLLIELWSQSGRLENALNVLLICLKQHPDDLALLKAAAKACVTLGDLDRARHFLTKILTMDPDDVASQVMAAMLLPIIAQSRNEIEDYRAEYSKKLDALANSPGHLTCRDLAEIPAYFYLAYHDQPNRDLAITRAKVLKHLSPDLCFSSPHVKAWQSPQQSGRRIRAGFISCFFHTHTIGKLTQGFLQQLDPERFDVVLIHATDPSLAVRNTPEQTDAMHKALNSHAGEVIYLPLDLPAQQQRLAEAKLDILFYTDIGMVPGTYHLAFSRLAPVQVTTWGHPDTTGLDTMDYFVSSRLIEPDSCDSHYSERLVCLDTLPCYYPLPSTSAHHDQDTRADFGLPAHRRLYACPQSLFKLHPDFDHALAMIAAQDPESTIVLIEPPYQFWREKLTHRWEHSCPQLLDHVVFVPRMSMTRYLRFIAIMDVLLDPFHFGSGNTLYEAMLVGVPIVTWPGDLMRGRIVAGAYRQMGIDNPPVATSYAQYAQLAVALAQDRQARDQLAERLRDAAKREIFSDQLAVHAMEAFFEAAMEAAGRNTWLSQNWCPATPV